MSDDKAKKLAAEVRSVSESTTFDLAGYGPQGCEALVSGGLAAPLPLKEMVRLSFVVGGGKKVRQKYGDALLGCFTDALKTGGFIEDKGAALSLDSAGTFKYQHNTDTDLKHVHVYPRVDPEAAKALESGENSADALSHAELLLFAEVPIFLKMVAAKCPTFAQKRAALDVVKGARSRVTEIEAKLASMEQIDETEQTFYDNVDAEQLQVKQEELSKVLEAIVNNGQLNAAEVKMVARQLSEKLETLEVQLATADSEGKEKRVAKLQQMRNELLEKISKTQQLKPIVHQRKHANEITQIKKRLKELLALEGSKKVLPLDEVQKLSAKPKLLEDLARLEAESKGWFPESII